MSPSMHKWREISVSKRKHEFISIFTRFSFYFNDNQIIFRFLFACRYTKPQTFADCVGDELPLGWEESYDQIIGRYYINHFDRECLLFSL